jgi:DNA polymerase-3 subunit beta
VSAFTVTGSALNEATAWALRIAPSRPALTHLGGLLLDASDDQVSFTAFDLDTCGVVTLPGVVREPGKALLSARLLAAIAKSVARDVDVTIEVDGSSAIVRCGKSQWSLPTMPAEDFPGLPQLADPAGEIDAEVLRHALSRVLPAVHSGNESAFQNLAAVKLDGDDQMLRLVATDRYRVAVADVPWKPTGDMTLDALAPSGLLEAAARAAGSGTVSLFCGDSTFGLATDTHRVIGRQIAQAYPVISRFMPVPGEHYAVVDVADLSRAIDEAMVMLDKEPAIKLAFDIESVEVSVAGDDRRSSAEATTHALYGDPVEFAVNAGFLRTALKAVESAAAVVHFSSRAVLILPSDADGSVIDGYEHVVMRSRL